MSIMDTLAVAREISARFGEAGLAEAQARSHENARAGEVEAAAYWTGVAQAIGRLRMSRPSHGPKASKLFPQAFKATPHPYMLLDLDLRILDANDAYLDATMTRRGDLVGCPLFEAFPDNPGDPDADGVKNLSASLERVLDRGRPDRMACQRYDVKGPDGMFQEMWWQPLNLPVFNDEGRFEAVLHHVTKVAPPVRYVPACRRGVRAPAG